MRGRMERLVALPFSISCVSQSSVEVGESQPKKAQADHPPQAAPSSGEGESQSVGKTKSSLGLLALPHPPSISAGLRSLLRGFKNLSQLFVVYREEDKDVDMEIGFPTDVLHVAHIGCDGFNNVRSMKSWEDRASEFLPVPALSLRQFEMAMTAQADAPLVQDGPLGA